MKHTQTGPHRTTEPLLHQSVADLHSKILTLPLGPMFFISARNEVGARLCFHRHLSFCSQGGCLHQCMLGCHTPRSRHSPWKQTPTRCRHTPPPEQTPPLLQSMLGDTVNKRAVRILLECNLVFMQFLARFLTGTLLSKILDPPKSIIAKTNYKIKTELVNSAHLIRLNSSHIRQK